MLSRVSWQFGVLSLALFLSFLLAKFGFWVFAFLLFAFGFLFCFLFFEKALFILAFLIPFEKTLALDIKGVTIRFSHLWLGLLFLVWILKMLLRQKFEIKNDRTFIYLGLYFLIALLSLQWAGNFQRGVEVLLFTFFALFSFWFIFQLLVKKREYYFLFLKGLLWGSLVAAIFGIFQYFGDWLGLPLWLTGIGAGYTKAVLGFPRVRATFFEPLYWGSFIIIIWPLVYFQIYAKNRVWPKKRLKLLLLLLLINLILTVARSSYLAFVVQAFVVALVSFVRYFRVRKTYWLSIAGLLFFAFLFVVVNFPHLLPAKIQSLISHATSISDWSSRERLTTWESALKAFRRSPLRGIGVGQFGPYWAGYPHQTPKSGWQIVNNQPLELLAETGVFGFLFILLFYLALIFQQVSGLRAKEKLYKVLSWGYLISLLGLAVQWQFFSTLYIVYLFVFFALALVNSFYAQNKA